MEDGKAENDSVVGTSTPRRPELPSTEMRRAAEGVDSGSKIRSSVVNMLS